MVSHIHMQAVPLLCSPFLCATTEIGNQGAAATACATLGLKAHVLVQSFQGLGSWGFTSAPYPTPQTLKL